MCVSALSYPQNHTRACAGEGKGQVAMQDLIDNDIEAAISFSLNESEYEGF